MQSGLNMNFTGPSPTPLGAVAGLRHPQEPDNLPLELVQLRLLGVEQPSFLPGSVHLHVLEELQDLHRGRGRALPLLGIHRQAHDPLPLHRPQ